MNTIAFLTFALSISAPDASQPQVRVPATTVTVIGQKELDEEDGSPGEPFLGIIPSTLYIAIGEAF